MELDYANLIANVGFPIVISLYFMFRMEKTLDKNTQAMEKLTIIIQERRNGKH